MFNTDSLPGNHHYKNTTFLSDKAPSSFSSLQAHISHASEADTQATLALAYELRTLNLQLYFRHIDRQGDLPDMWLDLAQQVTERLGLADG